VVWEAGRRHGQGAALLAACTTLALVGGEPGPVELRGTDCVNGTLLPHRRPAADWDWGGIRRAFLSETAGEVRLLPPHPLPHPPGREEAGGGGNPAHLQPLHLPQHPGGRHRPDESV
jgi:hypothetical protein